MLANNSKVAFTIEQQPNKFPWKLFIILIALVVGSCFYEPSGEFFKDIPEKDYSNVSVDLNDQSDTIYISKFTNLRYSINTEEYHFSEIQAELNGEKIFSDDYFNGWIPFDPYYFGTGTHSLSLKLIIHSGTGSLADKNFKEFTQVWRNYIVIVDIDPPPQISKLYLDTTQGTMRVSWDAFKKWTFEEYVLTKYTSKDNYSWTLGGITLFDMQTDTSWIDHSYVGGYVKYSVDVKAANQTSSGLQHPYKWSPITSFDINKDKLQVSWSRPFFYNNIESIKIFPPNHRILGVEDSTLAIDGPFDFGGYSSITITYTSIVNSAFNLDIPYFVGKSYFYPIIRPKIYSKLYNLYYGDFNNAITVMDNEFNPINVREFNNEISEKPFISPNGAILLILRYENGGIKWFEADPQTLKTKTEVYSPYLFDEVQLTNNGFACFKSGTSNIVAKLSDFQVIYNETTSPFDLNLLRISTEGSYLFSVNKILKLNGEAYEEIGTLPNQYDILDVLFINDAEFAVAYRNGNIEIMNAETLEVEKTFSTGLESIFKLNYDNTSNLLLVSEWRRYKIINLNTDDIITIPTSTDLLSLVNGRLVATSGYSYRFFVVDYEFFQ